MQKKCKHCGKEFNSSKVNKLYCSDECKKKSRKNMSRKRKGRKYAGKPNAAVIDVAVKARKAGMSYGQYVATSLAGGGEDEKIVEVEHEG